MEEDTGERGGRGGREPGKVEEDIGVKVVGWDGRSEG